MGKIVRLFIGEREVDFKTTPDIFYNFTEEDLTNPTVVNNSFSKTITIEGTPNNNKIFGMFWNLDRYQVYEGSTGTGFNPSKKTPFKLFVNGELYESGYVKLDAVRKNGNAVEYDVTLFGGLGEFFFELSYDDDGNQLTLADLTYRQGGDSSEFDFTINKETIYDAWIDKTPYCSDSYLWHYINFAPCYNGYPDNLSADKALINFSGLTSTIDSAVTSGGTTYTTRNGYALGTLPDKLDEWAVRDLRSWAQRPVFRVKGMFDGIKRYAEGRGYEMKLDDTFFTQSNPYYWDAWITLPMLSETNIAGTSDAAATVCTPTINYRVTYNGWTNSINGLAFSPELPVGVSRVDMNLNLRLMASSYSQSHMGQITGETLYTSANFLGWSTPRAFGGIAVQVLCYDGERPYNSNVIGGSECKILTSKIGDDYLKASEIGSTYWLRWGSNYSYVFGQFEPMGGYAYDFSEPIPLSFDVPTNTRTIMVSVVWVANLVGDGYQTRLGRLWTEGPHTYQYDSGSSINTVIMSETTSNLFTDTTASAYTANESAGYTGAKLTKKALLSTENTPADYLLSYCKQFGLHFYKKPSEKTIYISQRGTFYDWNGEVVDLSDKIDTSEGIDISPLSFDAKWYNMVLESVGGDFATKYQNTYGRTYGIQKVNTGYEFTAEEKNIFDGNIFKGAVEGTGKDKYYLAPVNVDGNSNTPYVIYQGLTYQLYTNSTGTTTVNLDDKYGAVQSQPLGNDKYYDCYQKVQFCDEDKKTLDGKDVLLFFNGIKTMQNSAGKMIPYYITDDVADMGNLNGGKPCWILTSSEFKQNGSRIAYETNYLPSFSRNILNDMSKYITFSWDFGQPKELFIPEALSVPGGTIYTRFWQNYLTDLYDVNTRIMRCKVIKDEFKASPELFRKFYWYGNSLWRLNKIEDWNIATADKGSAEFVKVNVASAYSSKVVDGEPEATFTVEPTSVAKSGGTVTGYITVSDGGGWYFEGLPDYVTVTPAQGRGDDTVQIQISASTVDARLVYVTLFCGEYSTYTATIMQGTAFGVTPTAITAFNESLNTNISIIDANNSGWTISTPAWIIPSQQSGTGSATIGISVLQNDTASARTGNIVITNSTTSEQISVVVDQAGPAVPYIVPTSREFAASGGTSYLFVTDNNAVGWVISDVPGWLTFSQLSGAGNAEIQVDADPNTGSGSRTVVIGFDAMGQHTAVTIVQDAPGTDYPITVSPASISASEAGQQTLISITDRSNHSWTITSPAWVTLGSNTGTGSAQVMANIARNYDSSARMGNIVVTDRSNSGTTAITVTQEAAYTPPSSNCIINFTYGSVYIPQTGTYDEYTVYYSEESAHPVGEGMGMLSISCGSPLYSGNTWTPSAGNYWGAYSPFSEVDLSDNTKLSVPSEFAGKTIYLQVEFGSAELGFALESTVVEVQIPANGGTINVTIPDF